MADSRLKINGTALPDYLEPLEAVFDPDPPAERSHSGAPLSLAWVGITFMFRPLTPAQGSVLSALADSLGGRISTITAPPRDYASDTWGTVTADALGMWPHRPAFVLASGHHLLTESVTSDKGPTWHIDRVAPAKV